MNQAPVITQAHFEAAFEQHGYHTDLLTIINTCNQIALAEQATQYRFISADEARAIVESGGRAEWQGRGKLWTKCDVEDIFLDAFSDAYPCKYRAIRKEVPTEPTCQVKNLDTGVTETMTREAAKKLQAETKDVCDWFYPNEAKAFDSEIFDFDDKTDMPYFYKLKAKKQVSWKDVPAGVVVRNKSAVHFVFLGVSSGGDTVYVFSKDNPNTALQMLHGIELAPADQQPWLNWRGGNCPVQEGVIVEVTLRDTRTSKHKLNAQGYKWKHSNRDDDIIEYRVIGIADGWELK